MNSSLKFSSDGLSKKITLIQGDLKLGLGGELVYLLTVNVHSILKKKIVDNEVCTINNKKAQ
jgi:hypothetical protein